MRSSIDRARLRVSATSEMLDRLGHNRLRACALTEEGSRMARFITFFSYTGDSMKAMVERPSDRSAATKALVESLGGTLEAFYWMQGKHDGFLISNLPDGVTAAALVGAVGSTGAVEGLETHQI